MENASKALIIAGAILLSILLISVGILIFNSSKGTSDSAQSTSDVLEIAEISARAKIILDTSGIEEPKEFNGFIREKYGRYRKLTKEEVIELCELVKAWGIKVTGKDKHSHDVTHVSCTTPDINPNLMVYQPHGSSQIVYDKLKDGQTYVLDDWQFSNETRDWVIIFIKNG